MECLFLHLLWAPTWSLLFKTCLRTEWSPAGLNYISMYNFVTEGYREWTVLLLMWKCATNDILLCVNLILCACVWVFVSWRGSVYRCRFQTFKLMLSTSGLVLVVLPFLKGAEHSATTTINKFLNGDLILWFHNNFFMKLSFKVLNCQIEVKKVNNLHESLVLCYKSNIVLWCLLKTFQFTVF